MIQPLVTQELVVRLTGEGDELRLEAFASAGGDPRLKIALRAARGDAWQLGSTVVYATDPATIAAACAAAAAFFSQVAEHYEPGQAHG